MIPCFPDPFPDELFYSACARFSDHRQYVSKAKVIKELFGSPNVWPIIDLPCHLGVFIGRLPIGHSCTIDTIINNHTLLPLYSPFMDQKRIMAIREQMITGDGQSLHRKMGIAQPTVPRISRLRYCPSCLKEDKKNFGEPYWHRLHHIPGVDVCHIHSTFIEETTIQVRKPFSRPEFISANHVEVNTPPRSIESSSQGRVLLDIAKDVAFLLEHPGISLSPQEFIEKYQALLAQRGYISKGGLTRHINLLNDFVNYYVTTLLKQFIRPVKPGCAYNGWLARLTTSDRDTHPPLHHILTIHFLGLTAEAFFGQKIEPYAPFGGGPWPCLNIVCKHYQQGSITELQIKYTQKKDNRCIGIFACVCGFTYSRVGPDKSPEDLFRKDKVISYGSIWEARLRELWLDPTITRRDIARSLQIGEQTVTRYALKLGLPVPRKSPRPSTGRPRLNRNREWYRTQWLAHIEGKLTASPCPKASTLRIWLSRFDREWFIAHRSVDEPKRRTKTKTNSIIEFPKDETLYRNDAHSDAEIAQLVRITQNKIINVSYPLKRIFIATIIKHVPQLLSVDRKDLAKWPLTIEALNEAVETREAFTIRRIRWLTQQYQREKIHPTRSQFLKRAHIRTLLYLPGVKQAYEDAMTTLLQTL